MIGQRCCGAGLSQQPPPPRRRSVPCATTRPAPTHERYLVFASGHVRSLSATAETLHRHVVADRPAVVDVVYSVWHDAGYGCEERILRTSRALQLYDFPRPAPVRPRAEYEFSRGKQSVGRYQEGARCGAGHARRRRSEVRARLKARTDLAFSKDLDLKESPPRRPAVQKANGHWLMVSACLQGADIFMLGTPALILQHFSGSKSHSSEGGNLENKLRRARRRTDRMGPGEQAGRAVLPGRRESQRPDATALQRQYLPLRAALRRKHW